MSKFVAIGDDAIDKIAQILHSISNDFTRETLDTVKGVVAGLLASAENKDCVVVERQDILSLISCAEDYGFAKSVLFGTFADWLGPVDPEEVEAYARELANEDGYGEEDYLYARETLEEWAAMYGKRS